jgi:hypothetical protein
MKRNTFYFMVALLATFFLSVSVMAQDVVADTLAAVPDSLTANSMVDKYGRPVYLFQGWISGVWLWFLASIAMAVIALLLRFCVVKTRHSFNGNGFLIIVAIIGAVAKMWLHPEEETIEYAPLWMATLIVCYILVAFVPDPLGKVRKDGVILMFGFLGKLPALISFIIVVALLAVALVAGQVIIWVIPFFTLFKLLSNIMVSFKVMRALKNGEYDNVEEINEEEGTEA